jgi:hypothetical protein
VHKFNLQTIVIIFVALLVPDNFLGQMNIDSLDFNQKVYWFPVKVKVSVDIKTKKERYSLSSVGKRSRTGTLLDFEKELYKGLIRRNHIMIGPFSQKEEADRAFPLYRLSKHTEKTMEKVVKNCTDTIQSFYWFVSPPEPKRISPFSFERAIVKTSFGSLNEFKKVLWEGVFLKQLAIGPFTSEKDAKISRWLYRLEED